MYYCCAFRITSTIHLNLVSFIVIATKVCLVVLLAFEGCVGHSGDCMGKCKTLHVLVQMIQDLIVNPADEQSPVAAHIFLCSF